jgi:hypothetical protein
MPALPQYQRVHLLSEYLMFAGCFLHFKSASHLFVVFAISIVLCCLFGILRTSSAVDYDINVDDGFGRLLPVAEDGDNRGADNDVQNEGDQDEEQSSALTAMMSAFEESGVGLARFEDELIECDELVKRAGTIELVSDEQRAAINAEHAAMLAALPEEEAVSERQKKYALAATQRNHSCLGSLTLRPLHDAVAPCLQVWHGPYNTCCMAVSCQQFRCRIYAI